MTDQSTDPRILALRGQITEADRAILDVLNERLALVEEIFRYKTEKGYDLVDPGREKQLLDDLCSANNGPLTDAGLREIYAAILELMKRETAARANR